MLRAQLLQIQSSLENEFNKRVALGGYGADAEIIKFLTRHLYYAFGQLIQHDKEIARLKRAPKKKKK